MISSRDENAELVKVFLHRDEKNQLKEAAAKKSIPVSHLLRSLALAWVEENLDPETAKPQSWDADPDNLEF